MNPQVNFYIPKKGQEIVLISEWEFILAPTYENQSFSSALGFEMFYVDWDSKFFRPSEENEDIEHDYGYDAENGVWAEEEFCKSNIHLKRLDTKKLDELIFNNPDKTFSNFKINLPKGTRLIISKMHMAKNKNDVSFFVFKVKSCPDKEKHKKISRKTFYVGIPDVNNIFCEIDLFPTSKRKKK